jgi:hypothetical protein
VGVEAQRRLLSSPTSAAAVGGLRACASRAPTAATHPHPRLLVITLKMILENTSKIEINVYQDITVLIPLYSYSISWICDQCIYCAKFILSVYLYNFQTLKINTVLANEDTDRIGRKEN